MGRMRCSLGYRLIRTRSHGLSVARPTCDSSKVGTLRLGCVIDRPPTWRIVPCCIKTLKKSAQTGAHRGVRDYAKIVDENARVQRNCGILERVRGRHSEGGIS